VRYPIIKNRIVVAYIYVQHPLGITQRKDGDYEVYFKEAI